MQDKKDIQADLNAALHAWIIDNPEHKAAAFQLCLVPPGVPLHKHLNRDNVTYIVAKPDLLSKALDHWLTLDPLEDELITIISATYAAHTLRLPEALPQHIASIFDAQEETFEGLKVALAETVLNAIEHGNLDLGPHKKKLITNEDYFGRYYDIVDKRLSQPEYGNLFVTVRCCQHGPLLSTSVAHQGRDFDHKVALAEAQDSLTESMHERGLRLLVKIVDSVRYVDGGRRIIFETPIWKGVESGSLLNAQEIYANGKILVVDDQQLNRELASHFLTKAGFKHVIMCSNGEEALELADKLRPDLILLDIMMPGVDGFEVCRRLKRNPHLAQIPVIYLSALTDISSRTRGYELGAVDYINKPIQHNELLARTEVHIKNGMLLNRLQDYSKRVRAELHAARQFQTDLLPKDEDLQTFTKGYNVELRRLYQGSQELAGDYWTALPVNNECFALIMADFVGHGVVSALNMVRLHGALYELDHVWADPIALSYGINKRLVEFLPADRFATALVGIYNSTTGTLHYTSCGHPPIAHVRKNGEPELISQPGLPLGVAALEMESFDLHEIQLEVGETLVLFSDAITESEHRQGGEMFRWDDDGLLDVLRSAQAEAPEDIFSYVRNQFFKTAIKPLHDDVTLITLRRK